MVQIPKDEKGKMPFKLPTFQVQEDEMLRGRRLQVRATLKNSCKVLQSKSVHHKLYLHEVNLYLMATHMSEICDTAACNNNCVYYF